MSQTMMEPFAAYLALTERKSIDARLAELSLEEKTSWREREIDSLRRDLAEVDAMVVRHREAARYRAHMR